MIHRSPLIKPFWLLALLEMFTLSSNYALLSPSAFSTLLPMTMIIYIAMSVL